MSPPWLHQGCYSLGCIRRGREIEYVNNVKRVREEVKNQFSVSAMRGLVAQSKIIQKQCDNYFISSNLLLMVAVHIHTVASSLSSQKIQIIHHYKQ
jgi:hypothetical protein